MEKLIVWLEITSTMKTHMEEILGHLKGILAEEKLAPIRVAKHKCTRGCGHKQTCQQL